MTAALLLVLGMLCLWMTIHPYLTYPLSLAALHRFKPAHSPGLAATQRTSKFAICTCAYNEEGIIEEKAQNLLSLKQRHPELDILIYVDAAMDNTAAILRRYENEFRIVVAEERHGKTHGMNRLVAMTEADIVIFTDANVMLDMEVVDRLAAHFTDPTIGCVCGNLVYTNAADSSMAQTGSFYWRLEQRIKHLESHWGAVMGADGSLFAIRRKLHTPPPDHIIDDMYVSFHVLFQGHQVIQADDVIAYEKTVAVSHEEFRRKIRIACQAFNVHRLMWPLLKRMSPLELYMYVSHKLMRWFSIYFLFAAALFITTGLLLGRAPWLAMVGVTFAALAAIAGWVFRIRLFAQAMDIVTAFLGTGIGVLKSLSGEMYQTWKPAGSIR